MPHDDDVIASAREWERQIGSDSRRFLMLYRERDGEPLTADVLELFAVAFTREANGRLRAWLEGAAPAVAAEKPGRKWVSWSRQIRIPMDKVAYRERLPRDFPGFDGFEAGAKASDGDLHMKNLYGNAVRRALRIAEDQRLA